MHLFAISLILSAAVGFGLASLHTAYADVWIPDNEFSSYYDANGTFTVIGAVKNTDDKPIIPTVTFSVDDSGRQVVQSYTLSIVNSGKDIPFKIKMPEVEGYRAMLEKPQVKFAVSDHNAVDVEIVYDKTLRKHADGHNTGFIINNDTVPSYGVKVYAAIYGKDGKFLDVGKSIETIPRIDPGQKIAFSMYPDPERASKISYYSCFALGDDPTQTVTVTRNGQPFYFTYLSSGYVSDAKFDDFSQSVSFTIRYPFPDRGFVNFMIPQESDQQKYSVAANGKPLDFLQSKDPDGFWHVAFDLAPRSTMHVTIAGFDQHPVLPVGNFRNYLLVAIPVAAAIASIIIWKKKRD